MKANKRDYAVDKLGDDRSTRAMNPFWRTDESGRFLSVCVHVRMRMLFRNTSRPAVAPKITRIGEMKTVTKSAFSAHLHIDIFSPYLYECATNVLTSRLVSAHFSELTRCPRSFTNTPRPRSGLFLFPFSFQFVFALCPLCFLQSRFSSVKNCPKNAVRCNGA